MNCGRARREIEETDASELLSGAAKAHLATCTACETLSRQQNNLRTIISSLETVEAPGDFDFRLRARLAGERTEPARGLSWGNFSFGLRAAALSTVVLLLGSAFVFVTLKIRTANPTVAGGRPLAANTVTSAPRPSEAVSNVQAGVTPIVKGTEKEPVEVVKAAAEPQQKHRNFRNAAAAIRGSNLNGTREMASSQAPVLRPFDESVETYPTAAFPINASYQSLKVSVDDGRGASRTISLPTVSFGSQRALSQSASPLVAAARGVW
jgi:anti-sigma factor RsiW